MKELIFPGLAFLFAFGCMALLVYVMRRDNKGVKASYTFLSLMYGLKMLPAEPVSLTPHPTVAGIYKDRMLTIASKSRFIGNRYRAYTLITVEAPECKEECTVYKTYFGAGPFAKDKILLGDETFDEQFIVKGSVALAKRVLTPEVQSEIMRVEDAGMSTTYTFGHGKLTCHITLLIHNDARMRASELIIATLYKVAELLPRAA